MRVDINKFNKVMNKAKPKFKSDWFNKYYPEEELLKINCDMEKAREVFNDKFEKWWDILLKNQKES